MNKKNFPKGTALVTGGAKRIGKAICLALASWGYSIALHIHESNSEAQKLAQQIKKNKGICEIFTCDLADEIQTRALIPTVLKKLPNLNIIINNASIFKKSSLKKNAIKMFNQHYSINLKAPYILISEFAQRREKGHIINILDTNIVKNKTGHGSYLLSKKSLHELTKLAAVELAPDIRVNAIAPGLILPPVDEKQNYLDRLAKSIPLKHIGHVSHITSSIKFLMDNSFITGETLFNDGGEHLI